MASATAPSSSTPAVAAQDGPSTSAPAGVPRGWDLKQWLWAGRRVPPPPRLPAQPGAQVVATAAAEAAAAIAAWEEEGAFGVGEEHDVEEYYEEHLADPFRPLKMLLAGGVAGAVSRSATAPIDRLKMLLQIQDTANHMSVRQGIARMAAEGSVRAFFKGNGTNVLKIAPETAIKLTMNDVLKQMVTSDPDDISPGERMVAGALAGAMAQSLIYPLELVRTRLAVCPPGTYNGIVHCVRQVFAHEGWRAFYRGMVPSMLGILPYAGVDITIFELLKEELLDEYDGMPPPHMILGAGMCSSSIAQFASYPLALVRTRLQAQGVGGASLKYTGMMDVLTKTIRREGVRGLYKGSLTNLAKVAPAAGISWFTFEETKMLLGVDVRS